MEYSSLLKTFLDKLPEKRLDDYHYLKSKPREENTSPKITNINKKNDVQKDDHTNDKNKNKNNKVNDKIVSEDEESDLENETEKTNFQNGISDKETDYEIDNNSVYESAGESDISKTSSIKINESKEIEAFVIKNAKRPEK